MEIVTSPDRPTMGHQAARKGAALMREALEARGSANIIVATGASQLETLAALIKEPASRGSAYGISP